MAPPASEDVPPPPWDSTVEAVLWWQRSDPAARGALPAPLHGSALLGITIGGLISYRTGPVGPYRELFAAPLLLRRGRLVAHVPFMAVDSAASMAGGRRNWALPKELAGFEGDPARPNRTTVSGDGWSAAVTTSVRRRRAPFWAPFACVQVFPDGTMRSFVVTMRGPARLARVEVDAAVGAWLTPGAHSAVAVMGRQHVAAPS